MNVWNEKRVTLKIKSRYLSAKFRIFEKRKRMKYNNRITINPNICHGKPCIRGMRWPVEVVLDMLMSEMTVAEILEDHPQLEKEDIQASLEYAKLLVSGQSISIAA